MRKRKAVDDNHGLCPERPEQMIPSAPGPHIFQHPTNLTPTWCLLCGRAPAVLCEAHEGRHAWMGDCVNASDADARDPNTVAASTQPADATGTVEEGFMKPGFMKPAETK